MFVFISIHRVIEKFCISNAHKIKDDILPKIIDLCIADIIKSQDQCIQNSGCETLVAIGRVHCDIVMQKLTKQCHQGQVAHFMILHCMGTLATANINGIITFIKPTLEMILPTLSMIRFDHVKQAYAFGIGRFAEAITEHSTTTLVETDSHDIESIITATDFHTEIAIAYEVFMQQWLPSREPKVSGEILQALSHMYPLLSTEKISEQATRIIPQLLAFYRRSMDRNAITQFLSSVLKTTIHNDNKSLDTPSDTLISTLFDLVCVNPVYEKPQTVKGHYEVLRCFDLLVEIYPVKVFEMLLVQLRNNNERERIKSLLVITHLINTFDYLVSPRIGDFMPLIKQMLTAEKTYKVKMALLKTIVALSQRDIIIDADFIKFMLRHSCQLLKNNTEYGSADEQYEFLQACNNSLFLLSSTVRTMDVLLKQVLLQHYLIIDYTDICANIAKCLANLFAKNIDPLFMIADDTRHDDASMARIKMLPSCEAIFVRSIILLGNVNEQKRTENILLFLKYYGPLINDKLKTIWLNDITELQATIGKVNYIEKLLEFLASTIQQINDYKFAEQLVQKIADQIVLYPIVIPISSTSSLVHNEYFIPNFIHERGMLLKILGHCLCNITDTHTIEAKIDLIINIARMEKIDRNALNSNSNSSHTNNINVTEKLTDACEALGAASRVHCDIVMKKLEILRQHEGMRKSTSGFFSTLNFIKDSTKEADMLKVNLLAILSYSYIVQTAPQSLILHDIDTRIVAYLSKQLCDNKDAGIRKCILDTILIITKQILLLSSSSNENHTINCYLPSKSIIITQLLKIDFQSIENFQLFPIAMQVATTLLQCDIALPMQQQENDQILSLGVENVGILFEEFCRKFFQCAQQLKTKFDTTEDDAKNSWLAKHLNATIPEFNAFVRTMFEENATPSTLDDVQSVLEYWIRDPNSEVKICASHVMYNALEVSVLILQE